MKCGVTTIVIEDYLDKTLDAQSREEFEAHLAWCPDCRARFDQEQEFRASLKSLPTPPPDADFERRVLARAAKRQKRQSVNYSAIMRMAASIVIFIALGMLLKSVWGPAGTQWPEAFVTLERPSEVRLVFNAKQDMRNVTMTLEPPAGVELVGFESQRKIVWQTDLNRGRNLLALPVIARSRDGGSLIASIRHGDQHKEFGLLIKVQPSEPGDAGKHESSLSTRNSI